MSNESFYPLTSKTLEKLYQADLTAAEWRLWNYLVVTDPWGDHYKDLPDTLTIMEKVGIKKSTFYAAIAKFQKFELFDFQDKGFVFRNLQGVPKVRNAVQDSGSFSEISESIPKKRKPNRKNGTLSKNLENQPPEPAPSKASEVPHTIQTNSDLKDTTEEANCCVLEKFKDKLHFYQVYLEIYDQASNSVIPNPKIATIRKIIQGMPAERAERAIAAFLAWLPNAKNVRCKYAAFASSLRENWQT